MRQKRLISNGVEKDQIQKIFSVDEEEGVNYGQKVRDTIERSDFFVRNDGPNTDNLEIVIKRFVDITFDIGINTPTKDEAAMYTAVSAAASSACLSRQVGAAIYSATGELIGKGSNDVPKKGGGLYTFEDRKEDHRCYKFGEKICHNDDRKKRLYESIANDLIESKYIPKSKSKQSSVNGAISVIENTGIRDIMEYSRAIHAEMEAILSVARGGKIGLVGGTLYCTTFPCHNCARHIVAAGINTVFYIEPYPKSLAITLHEDAVSTKESDAESHVLFLQYEGVAPKNIVRLFRQHNPRKKDGRLVPQQRNVSMPVSRSPLDGFSTREQIVVNRVHEAEENVRNKIRGPA